MRASWSYFITLTGGTGSPDSVRGAGLLARIFASRRTRASPVRRFLIDFPNKKKQKEPRYAVTDQWAQNRRMRRLTNGTQTADTCQHGEGGERAPPFSPISVVSDHLASLSNAAPTKAPKPKPRGR